MATVTFNEDTCKGCGLCIEVCPTHIIQFAKKPNVKGYLSATVLQEDMAKCTGCTFCAIMCPDLSIAVNQ